MPTHIIFHPALKRPCGKMTKVRLLEALLFVALLIVKALKLDFDA